MVDVHHVRWVNTEAVRMDHVNLVHSIDYVHVPIIRALQLVASTNVTKCRVYMATMPRVTVAVLRFHAPV